ncbi:MAG: transketolase [Actinomycetota bacterium]|nr:transketolase [Actinomycetota bacterium]
MTTGADIAINVLATQLRIDAIRCSTAAGSGHPTSSLSAADLMAVLLAKHLRYDWSAPQLPTNDHLVFSKGHASPLLYAMFRAAGAISEEELLTTYRRVGSRLQGHPTPALPWVDVATGSLGQGLPAAVGIAIAGQFLEKLPYHVWVLCGDSEMAEGSMWEALDKGSHYGLSNLTAIVDVNRLGQRGPTELGWDLDAYRRRVEAFGCRAILVDGHDVEAIDAAFSDSRADADHLCVVLARTVKGRGVKELEDAEGWHGRALPADLAERAISALGGPSAINVTSPPPPPPPPVRAPEPPATINLPRYELGSPVATRRAFGDALKALAARPEVVVLDGEVANSTYTDEFAALCPERFFEMFISEQQMIGAAVGLAARGYRPFASTFAAFVSRAADFIRMAAISRVRMCINGSHAGVEIGADGPSQMGLEDLALMQAIHGSTVLYPSDATSAAALTMAMADLCGISYLRTTRGAYPVLYDPGESFPIGGAKTLRSSENDEVCLVGAGVTVHQCLDAANELATEGICARVIDAYSVKPIDASTLLEACTATGGRLVVAEDHHPEGGLGAAVALALSADTLALSADTLALSADTLALSAERGQSPTIAHLAVRAMPTSGTSVESLDVAGISARHIRAAAHTLVRRS